MDIFIGYDPREDIAYQVCVASIMKYASIPVRIHRLDQDHLRSIGFYWRPWVYDRNQKIDLIDKRPFSTEFAFARFLVPSLMALYQRSGPALFVDCDFMFRDDVGDLFDLFDDSYLVQCVQHDYQPDETVKMDGQVQSRYRRKNWSSLMMFNCDRCRIPVSYVNGATGAHLHQMEWAGEKIGALPEAWNWLEGHSDEAIEPKAVHFTRGGPWFEGYENVAYADEWRDFLKV